MTIQRNAKLIQQKKDVLWMMQERAREQSGVASQYNQICNKLEKELYELQNGAEEDSAPNTSQVP